MVYQTFYSISTIKPNQTKPNPSVGVNIFIHIYVCECVRACISWVRVKVYIYRFMRWSIKKWKVKKKSICLKLVTFQSAVFTVYTPAFFFSSFGTHSTSRDQRWCTGLVAYVLLSLLSFEIDDLLGWVLALRIKENSQGTYLESTQLRKENCCTLFQKLFQKLSFWLSFVEAEKKVTPKNDLESFRFEIIFGVNFFSVCYVGSTHPISCS